MAALVAGVRDSIMVAGGRIESCPPGSDCITPGLPHADGARYDLGKRRWRRIAEAPVGVEPETTAVVGDDVYTLTHCYGDPICPEARALLRYRSDADEWDFVPAPEALGEHYDLIAVPDGLIAYYSSSYRRFIAEEERWLALPDDPLPETVYERSVVLVGGRLFVFGTPGGAVPRGTKVIVAYDLDTGAWQELTTSGRTGFRVWRAGSLLYFEPDCHYVSGGLSDPSCQEASGGIYDPEQNLWRSLPARPRDYDLVGVVGEDEATYDAASGWVFDARTESFWEIVALPGASDVYRYAFASGPGLSLVVFGGQHWTPGRTWNEGEGRLLADTWRWTPPAADEVLP